MSPVAGLTRFLIISLPFLTLNSYDDGCVFKAETQRKSYYMDPKMARQSEIELQNLSTKFCQKTKITLTTKLHFVYRNSCKF